MTALKKYVTDPTVVTTYTECVKFPIFYLVFNIGFFRLLFIPCSLYLLLVFHSSDILYLHSSRIQELNGLLLFWISTVFYRPDHLGENFISLDVLVSRNSIPSPKFCNLIPSKMLRINYYWHHFPRFPCYQLNNLVLFKLLFSCLYYQSLTLC